MAGRTQLAWGVHFSWAIGSGAAIPLLYAPFSPPLAGPRYAGEPIWPLLFTSRGTARAWCRRKRAAYAHYPKAHVCSAWRWRPVRVRLTVGPA